MTNVFWQFLRSRALEAILWAIGAFSCSLRNLYSVIISRLITCHTKNRLSSVIRKTCYPDLLSLMIKNLLISCIVLSCSIHSTCTSILYFMNVQVKTVLTLHLYLHVLWKLLPVLSRLLRYHMGEERVTLPGRLEKQGATLKSQWILNQQHKEKIQ